LIACGIFPQIGIPICPAGTPVRLYSFDGNVLLARCLGHGAQFD